MLPVNVYDSVSGNVPQSSLAIDGRGNIWTTTTGSAFVAELTGNGSPVTGSPFFTIYNFATGSLAIDSTSFLWVRGNDSNHVSELVRMSTANAGVSGVFETGMDAYNEAAIAIDAAGAVWQPITSRNYIQKLSNVGSTAANYMNGGIGYPIGVAIDNQGDAWIANFTSSNNVTVLSNNGVPLGGSPIAGVAGTLAVAVDANSNAWFATAGSTVTKVALHGSQATATTYSGGVPNACGIAIDGDGTVWVGGNSQIGAYSNDGLPLTTGLTAGYANHPCAIGVDPSGSVWASGPYGYLVQFIGLGAPTSTPIGPGRLGVRP